MTRRRKLRNEDEERAWWATHDSVGEVVWSRERRVTLPNLKPSVTTISLRPPEWMLEDLKTIANKRNVPYQTLIKLILADRIERENSKSATRF